MYRVHWSTMYGVLSSRRPRAIAMFPDSNFHSSARSFRIPDLFWNMPHRTRTTASCQPQIAPSCDRTIEFIVGWTHLYHSRSGIQFDICDYRMLLYHGRALQATHMLPYSWYSVRRILHTRWSLPINVCARLDGYPAVRRVYSALFGAVRVCSLPEFCCLSLGILPGESASQAKKQKKKAHHHE